MQSSSRRSLSNGKKKSDARKQRSQSVIDSKKLNRNRQLRDQNYVSDTSDLDLNRFEQARKIIQDERAKFEKQWSEEGQKLLQTSYQIAKKVAQTDISKAPDYAKVKTKFQDNNVPIGSVAEQVLKTLAKISALGKQGYWKQVSQDLQNIKNLDQKKYILKQAEQEAKKLVDPEGNFPRILTDQSFAYLETNNGGITDILATNDFNDQIVSPVDQLDKEGLILLNESLNQAEKGLEGLETILQKAEKIRVKRSETPLSKFKYVVNNSGNKGLPGLRDKLPNLVMEEGQRFVNTFDTSKRAVTEKDVREHLQNFLKDNVLQWSITLVMQDEEKKNKQQGKVNVEVDLNDIEKRVNEQFTKDINSVIDLGLIQGI